MFRKLNNKTKNPKRKPKLKSKSKLNDTFLINTESSTQSFSSDNSNDTVPTTSTTTPTHTPPQNETAQFLESLKDPEVIERVRVTIKQAHVFKLPTRQTVSVGWRGADWKDKVWQGNVKVVERGGVTAVLLVDEAKDTIFAVCPVGGDGKDAMLEKGAVDRCVDSSRYFVLRIQNENGRNMFIGVAFNERTDAFDFNAALEDSRRERRNDSDAASGMCSEGGSNLTYGGSGKDYSLKDGEKIRVAIPRDRGSGSTCNNRDKSNNMAIHRSGEKTVSAVGGTQAFDDFNQTDTCLTEEEEDGNDVAMAPSGRPSSSHIIKSRVQDDQHEGVGLSSLFRFMGVGSPATTKTGFLKPSTKDTPSRSKKTPQ